MAIDRVPALKRCRALGIEPAVIGRSKESKRQPRRTNRKVSEYGMQLKEKQAKKICTGKKNMQQDTRSICCVVSIAACVKRRVQRQPFK